MLALAFGAAGLEGFQTAEGFDQHCLTLGAEAQAFLHGVTQAHLNRHGEDDGDRKRQQRNHHQPAAEQADHYQHQHHEGQVDQAGQGHGGEKLTQALKVVNALGKAADGRRPRFHRHAGDALEQRCREDHIGFLAGGVEQVRTHHAQHQFKTGTDQQTDRQHPQRRGRLIGHHAIVGLHDEQRHHQAEQVDQKTGENRIAVQPFRQFKGVAKPRIYPWHQRRAQVFEFVARTGEQGLADVVFAELFATDPLLAAVGFAGQQQGFAILAKAPQHGGAAVVEQQQDRQVQRRNVFQVTAQQARLQSGPRGCTGQQIEAQALFVQRQPGAQAGTTDRGAMQFAEDQQAVE